MWLHPCNVHLFVSALLWDQTTNQARSYVHMISLLMCKMAALASGPSLLQAAHLRSFHCFPLGVVAVVLCTDAQSYPTLCDPMDYSPPGSSVHGISQARILEWVAISSSRNSYPGVWPGLCLAAGSHIPTDTWPRVVWFKWSLKGQCRQNGTSKAVRVCLSSALLPATCSLTRQLC